MQNAVESECDAEDDVPGGDGSKMRPEEWVIWGYRLLLGREPEDAAVIRLYCDDEDFSPEKLVQRLFKSAEFRALHSLPEALEAPEDVELRQLKAEFMVQGLTSSEGHFTDFLGVRTRCDYLPDAYAGYSGIVEHPDGSGVVPLHEPAEVIALLRSVEEGTGLFTIVELGAGWGPWLVSGAAATRQRGRPSRLIGVEGDIGHLGFMHTHMEDNGIDPAAGHVLLRAVIGSKDGVARFPILPKPNTDWGAKASFVEDQIQPGDVAAHFLEVPAISIQTLLGPLDSVEHMHCDIQGEEASAFEASAGAVNAKVRRLVVGTHGRSIEERLFHLFSALEWTLEYEKSCTFLEGTAGMTLKNDGVQVWRNPRLI